MTQGKKELLDNETGKEVPVLDRSTFNLARFGCIIPTHATRLRVKYPLELYALFCERHSLRVSMSMIRC
jgi:hypothetical protein